VIKPNERLCIFKRFCIFRPKGATQIRYYYYYYYYFIIITIIIIIIITMGPPPPPKISSGRARAYELVSMQQVCNKFPATFILIACRGLVIM